MMERIIDLIISYKTLIFDRYLNIKLAFIGHAMVILEAICCTPRL